MRSPIIKLFSILFLFVALKTNAQVKTAVNVTFELTAPDLGPDSAVYITGSLAQLGSWDPGKVKMDYKGNHVWTRSITLNAPVSIEYKYTRGSWAHEAANKDGNALPNFTVKIIGNRLVTDSVSTWTKGNKPVIKGQITGTVKYLRNLKGAGIKDRDVIIWLPPGYDTDKTVSYPVIYMQDGQNVFDPATSSFGVDWQIDETADSLIRVKAVPPAIIVGVYNTADRMKEYMPGTLSKAYMNFIVNDLKPVIDANYRTKPDSQNTIAGGSSAGGILAFMLVWEHPDVFSKAICMSPAFKIENWDYVKVVQNTEKRKNVFFYIDNGGIALETQLQPGVNDMITALKTKGYNEGKDFVFIADPNAKHSESDWAKRFPNAMKLMFLKR